MSGHGNPNWKPGVSGNPSGRPKKGHTLTDALAEAIDKEDLARALLDLVKDGNIAAIKYAYDRIDGRPKETIEQTIRELPEVLEVYIGDDDPTEEDPITLEE